MLTDSMELYESRLEELHAEVGQYSEKAAAIDDARWLKGVTTDYMEELTYMGKKRVHNLKYYTGSSSRVRPMKKSRICGTSAITGPSSGADPRNRCQD